MILVCHNFNVTQILYFEFDSRLKEYITIIIEHVVSVTSRFDFLFPSLSALTF
jgi:hypothetical protein